MPDDARGNGQVIGRRPAAMRDSMVRNRSFTDARKGDDGKKQRKQDYSRIDAWREQVERSGFDGHGEGSGDGRRRRTQSERRPIPDGQRGGRVRASTTRREDGVGGIRDGCSGGQRIRLRSKSARSSSEQATKGESGKERGQGHEQPAGKVALAGATLPWWSPFLWALRGITDSLDISQLISLLVGSKTAQIATRDSVLLNGILFVGVMAILSAGDYTIGSLENKLDGDASFVTLMATSVSNLLSGIGWMGPVYIVSLLLSTPMNSKMVSASIDFLRAAPQTSDAKGGTKEHSPPIGQGKEKSYSLSLVKVKQQSILFVVGDVLYCELLCAAFIIMAVLLEPVGQVGPLLCFCSMAWYYSFRVFSSFFFLARGLPLSVCIRLFEERYMYFLGFGIPCTLMSYAVPNFFVFGGVYSMLYPLVRCHAHAESRVLLLSSPFE